MDDCADDPTTTCELALDTPTDGEIQFDRDVDWFKFEVEAETAYEINVTSPTLDFFDVSIFDSSESFISSGFGDDGSATFSFFASESEPYFVATEAFGDLGSYMITASVIVDDFPNDPSTSGVLSQAMPATGEIQFEGDVDWFRVSLDADATYTFDLRGFDSAGGSLSDPFMELYDPSRNLIASNDDGPQNLDSQISEFSPVFSGDYFVAAASNGSFGTGTYAFELTQTSGPVPPENSGPAPEDFENQIFGGNGDNPLLGTPMDDWIDGGDGRDNIFADDGDDYIIAGPGNDGFVRGGGGADIFQFGLGDETVKIFDWEAGLDQIRLVDGLSPDDLTVSSATFNDVTTTTFRTELGDRLDIRGANEGNFSDADFLGVDGDTRAPVNPNDFENQITDGDFDSTLTGTDRTDFIAGGGGRDNIFGDVGDDYIDAGSGNDGFVRGGAGADLFEFGLGSEAIKIFDWEDGTDLIALRDELVFEDLQVSEAEFDGITTVSLRTGDGDRLQIRDVDIDDIGVEDFFLV